MLLGSHVSIAGSLAKPFEDAKAIGCDAVQMFVKPPRKLRGVKDLTDEQIQVWSDARKGSAVKAIVVHANYLINLAPAGHTGEYSRAALLDEMKRCHQLGIGTLILHPGKCLGEPVEKGLANIAKGLQWCLTKGREYDDVTILLETMAGQGTEVGHDFAHLRAIIEQVAQPERFGACLDTCHAFQAGYELRTSEGYRDTMAKLDAAVGLSNVKAFHLNDAQKSLGERVDRHAAIGKGKLGGRGFQQLLQDPRWRTTPGVLETPHEDLAGFAADLRKLRKLEKEPFADKPLPGQRKLAS